MRATRPVKCAGVLYIETAMKPGSRRPLTGWRVRATEPSTITTRLSPMPAKLDMPASRPRSGIAGSAARVDPTRFGVPPFVSEAREPCAQLPHSASLPTRKCELYCVCCPWRADMQPLSDSTPRPRGRSRVRPGLRPWAPLPCKRHATRAVFVSFAAHSSRGDELPPPQSDDRLHGGNSPRSAGRPVRHRAAPISACRNRQFTGGAFAIPDNRSLVVREASEPNRSARAHACRQLARPMEME